MTEQTRPKTPEELGEAVGRKIEELFGTMFQEEGPASTPSSSLSAQNAVPVSDQPVEPSDPHGASEPAESPPGLEKSVSPSPVTSQAPEESSSPASQSPGVATEVGRQAASFQELIEQIEAVVLNLEWEVSQKSVSDLSHKLGEVEKFIPPSGLLRNFLTMHHASWLVSTIPKPLPILLWQNSSPAASLPLHSSTTPAATSHSRRD